MREVSYVAKGDKTVNGQYRFVSHDDVVAKLHGEFVNHEISVVSTVISCRQEGNRTEVELCIQFTNIDDPKDYIQVKYPGYGIDNSDKGPGKAISYAFKYALLKTFCLETGDDPDNDAKSRYEPVKCLDFDSKLPDDIDAKKMDEFLKECAEATNKHVEQIKFEALNKMEDLLRAFTKWSTKKKK